MASSYRYFMALFSHHRFFMALSLVSRRVLSGVIQCWVAENTLVFLQSERGGLIKANFCLRKRSCPTQVN